MAKKRKPTKKVSNKKKSNNYFNPSWIIVFFACGIIALGIWYYYSPIEKKINKNEFIKKIPKGFTSFGIDVSHHQGHINWSLLFNKEDFDTIIHFVYCKATEGNSYVDKKWNYNRKTLNNLGIPNGPYHFFISKEPPRPQVEHFLAIWKKRDVDLPPVLDVENEGFSDKDLRDKMKIWLEEVENKTGMRPIIYTSLNFYETKFKNYFPEYKFWIAAYSQKPNCLNDSRIIHWQYSENGILPGISEEVDMNVSKIPF